MAFARSFWKRVLLLVAGMGGFALLLTPTLALYLPAYGDWRWSRALERAQELEFGGPDARRKIARGSHGCDGFWRCSRTEWWSTSFGTAHLELVRRGPFFRTHVFLDFGPVETDAPAIAEARQAFPGARLEVRHPGGRWEHR